MSVRVYDDLEQGSDEWLQARLGLVTASVVGQLVTPSGRVARNETSRALMNQLVAERITGWSEPVFVTPDMWRGKDEEPLARDLYAETNQVQVDEVGFIVREETDWKLGYSPDGLIGDVGLLEIKSRKAKHQIRTILTDQVPGYHMAQLQAGLLVTGRAWIDYVSYSSALPMWTKRVYPDRRYMDTIIAAVEEFEHNAAITEAMYRDAVQGLPVAPRTPNFDHVELKL